MFRQTLLAGIAVCLLALSAEAKYSGGTGKSYRPYQIATAADLILLGETSEDYDKHFILTADIDLDPNLPGRKVFERAVIAPQAFDHTGRIYGPFTGVFNGNNHTISHLTIRGRNYLGLFGRLGFGSEVSNLGLEAVDVEGTGYSVGALAGDNVGTITSSYSTGTVTGRAHVGGLEGGGGWWDNKGGILANCYSACTVSGGGEVGGLAGENDGSISACYSTGTVSGGGEVGGLTGENDGSISACYSTGSVAGESTIGGLAGSNSGTITSSYSTGMATGEYDIGGLVGRNEDDEHATITLSYSTGSVTGDRKVGGLVGSNSNRGSITMSYSTGTASGERWSVGGLVGDNEGPITMSYSTGAVTGNNDVGGLVGKSDGGDGRITLSYSTGAVTGNNDVGGLVGRSIGDSITLLSFWDMETSGQPTSDGGTGLTTPEMQDISTYLGAGWDFVDETLNGTCDYWQISPGDYPRLRHQTGDGPVMPDGLGTAEQPYLIRDARDLGTVWFKPLAHYRLERSLDLSGTTWSMAVTPWFRGSFDGNGYVISNLHIQGGKFVGLFGQLGPEAMVSDLGLEAVDVEGKGGYVGGLAGRNHGTITLSHSTGMVTGNEYVGGLVGENGGRITTSYSTGSVNGDDRVGGLVGYNYDYSELDGIAYSYSTGTVTGGGAVGGLVGHHDGGSIISSYSTATVTETGHGVVGGLVGWREGGSITASYSTGMVTGFGGGLVGNNEGRTTSQPFWSGQTGTDRYGGTGLTTAEMQTASTFLEAGWDFVGESANGTDDIWWIPEGRGYPRLWWEKLYVDDDAPDDPGPGHPQISDPLEDGHPDHPFDSIQEAIDWAGDGRTVLVSGGVYGEPIDFRGKAIAVAGVVDADGAPVIEVPFGDAVTFHTGEGAESVLRNFIIRASAMGISLNYGSSPRIRNLTLVDNDFGIAAYENSDPNISNCILWNNRDGDLFQCAARYSCIESGAPGIGNISLDPLFADAPNGDCHLKSAGWSWNTRTQSWTYDDVTSPCIDAGDPDSPLGDELLSIPRDPDNQYGVNYRINMGAYGGTAQASMMPPLDWARTGFGKNPFE